MTPEEYVQLRAFARHDGAWLSLLWTASFASYVIGIANAGFGMIAVILMVATPFFVAKRLTKFRDFGLQGIISMRKGWGYVVLVFFYAAILFAVAQYIYFAYIDQGYLVTSFSKALSTPEAKEMLKLYGMQQDVSQSLETFSKMRPIDYVLNVLTVNVFIGILVGLPIGALKRRNAVT